MLDHLARNYGRIPRALWSVLLTQLVMNASHFMGVPLLAVYMVSRLRLGPLELGTVMAANLLSAQLLPLFTGPLADRYGFKILMVSGLVCRAIGLLGFAAWNNWIGLTAMAALMGIGVALYESGVYAVFGRQSKDIVRQVFVVNNQMLNAGVVIGPLIAGFLATIDIRLAFVGSGVLFLCLAIWSLALPRIEALPDTGTRVGTSLLRVLRDKRFGLFLLVCLPWFFLFSQLYVAFPVYLAKIAGDRSVPRIFMVNGITGLVFMLASMSIIDKLPPRKVLPRAYLAAAIFFSSASLSSTGVWFLLFVVCYTMVETLILPAIETLTADLAHDGSQSTFFGALSAGSALAGACGYYVGSWMVLKMDPMITWVFFGSVGLVGFILSLYFVSRERKLGVIVTS